MPKTAAVKYEKKFQRLWVNLVMNRILMANSRLLFLQLEREIDTMFLLKVEAKHFDERH